MHIPPVKFAKIDRTRFFATLNKNVNSYFKENNISKHGNLKMVFKTIAMFSIYLIPYFFILLGNLSFGMQMLCWAIMGLGLSGIGFSVAHDAVHGAYSRHKFWNKLLGMSFNAIGASSFTWKIQHNVLHHTYTNIYELDEDIDDKPFIRLSPHGKLKSYHKYQHWYAPLLYSLASLSWIIQKDFVQLNHYNRSGLTKKNGRQPAQELLKLIVSKTLYFTYIIVLPILILPTPWWYIPLGFVVMHLVAGFLLTIIFQLAHVVEGPSHHKPEENGTMENTWAIHQLNTTANFAKESKILSWFVGGLNFQVEHHLFPHICHVHYPEISKIVKQTAKEFNLPYYEQPSFTSAVISHLKVLRSFGNPKAA